MITILGHVAIITRFAQGPEELMAAHFGEQVGAGVVISRDEIDPVLDGCNGQEFLQHVRCRIIGSDPIISRRSEEGGDQGDEPRQIEHYEEKGQVAADSADHAAVSVVRFSDNLQNQTHDSQEEEDDGHLG